MKHDRSDSCAGAVEALIARYRASGLTLACFAREEGLPLGRLRYWVYVKGPRQALQDGARPVSAPVFQEVKVGALFAGGGGWAAEVSLSEGMAVRFSGAAAPGWIGAVVQALQRPC